MAELGDDKDSQTKTDIEVPGQPAGPIRFFGFIQAQSCEESGRKNSRDCLLLAHTGTFN